MRLRRVGRSRKVRGRIGPRARRKTVVRSGEPLEAETGSARARVDAHLFAGEPSPASTGSRRPS